MKRTSRSKGRYIFQPDYAVPPGETLRETMEALGLDEKKLARLLGLSEESLNAILEGNATITPALAIELEDVTKVPAHVWNNLEAQYQSRRDRYSK
jgi:addiction module HigA family antidote